MNDSIFKRKNILKAQYIYNIFLLLILLFGVSYALVTFIHNEEGLAGNIVSSLVKITVDEETSFNLDNTSPVTDEEGLQGYSKILTLTNTSSIDSLVNVSIIPDASNDIETSYIKYGLYINETLKKTGNLSDTIIYDGLLLQGEKVQIKVYLWVDSTYTGTGTIFKGTFEVKGIEAVMTMADYVTKLVDKDKGVYKVGNDYRYSGTNPDNYIWFNCKDGTTGGANNCELWQIIGSLETKANEYANTYRRVKIVKVDSLDNQVFGSNNTFEDSSLHTYLNGDYYTSLTSQSQKMIISSEWNVGSSSLTSTPATSLTNEAKTKVYKKVGLLSASDLGYSTSTDNQTKALNNADLYNNSWLKGSSYYTLTPVSGNTTSVIGNNSTSIASLSVTTASGVKPTVSLIPNVYIKAGNGTEKMPYELAIVDEEEHYSDVKVVGYITYDVNGQSVTAPKMQAIYADGSTVINAGFTDTTFMGWATSKDGEVVYQKGDTISAAKDVTLYAVWQVPKLVDKIISTLTLTDASNDIDGTRYVTGDNDTPNYLWYSGKLWRILSINGDGSIKLVTQGNMTTIAWNTTRSTDYSTSQVHSWLNNEFLPTLANSDMVLVDSAWDYTAYSVEHYQKETPVAVITNEKVGLLTIYDYYMTDYLSFLNNGYRWCTMSPTQEYSGMYWGVFEDAFDDAMSLIDGNGVRPSVNLKSDIRIIGGNGTKSNPYVIKGDKDTGTIHELLNNRISGEYINFNNTLYRIVGIEEVNGKKLTKITMADYREDKNKNTLTSLAYNEDKTQGYSPTSGVGLYLENWYLADRTSSIYAANYINDTYKAMIATNDDDGVVWYNGLILDYDSSTGYDYTLAKKGTLVSATIGLPYYGEMFSSQFGDGNSSSSNIWLMTISNQSLNSFCIFEVSNSGFMGNPRQVDGSGVRPSMYLKSDVKIVSGSGMPHDPYEITQ